MIPITDIRVGNWVLKENNFIDSDVNFYPHCVDSSDIFYESEFEGVELSSFIFERMGVKKDGFNSYNIDVSMHKITKRELVFSGDYLYIRESRNPERRNEDDIVVLWNKDIVHKFYLHQLQNLYFSLTGKELDIKL